MFPYQLDLVLRERHFSNRDTVAVSKLNQVSGVGFGQNQQHGSFATCGHIAHVMSEFDNIQLVDGVLHDFFVKTQVASRVLLRPAFGGRCLIFSPAEEGASPCSFSTSDLGITPITWPPAACESINQ